MSDLSRQLRLSILWVALLLAVGTLGFTWLGNRDVFHALYLTVVILTTVGMEGAATDGERALSLFLMLVGVGLVLYATGMMIAFFVEGHVRDLLGKRQMQMNIDKLNKHTIVVGFGRMGRALCEQMHTRRMLFVLVERDPGLVARAEAAHYLCVAGDAITEDVLSKGGIERASGVIVCLPRESDVVFVTLKSRGLNPDVTIIARGQFSENEPMLRHAGADRVIVPPVLGASRVIQMLDAPQRVGMADLEVTGHNLEVTTFEAADLPRAVDRPLGELVPASVSELTTAAVVHEDGSRLLRPPADYRLAASDQMIVLGDIGAAEQVLARYRDNGSE